MTVAIYGIDKPAAFRLESFMIHNDIGYKRELDTDNLYNMAGIQVSDDVSITLSDEDLVFCKYTDEGATATSVTIHSSDFYKISIL